MPHVELITPPADSPYDAATVLAACQGRHEWAGPGEAFSGRPVTALIDTGRDILKLRTEYRLPADSARRFVEQAIERERRLDVHHPHKTWFLWSPGDEETVVIGNIAPHLLALNDDEALAQRCSPAQRTGFLAQMLDDYLAVQARHELSLDLCLSNFGLDDQGRLFYLDDDLYPGSGLTILSDALGTWVRALPWLDEGQATALGERLASSLRRHFSDPHVVTVVAEGLRGVFIPPQRETVAGALIQALYGEQTFSYRAPEPRHDGTAAVMALIGDIHGNAPALERALDYLAGRGIGQGVMLGDVVGYGPHPRQCVAMVRALQGWSMVRGNHDHAVAHGEWRTGISAMASWSLDWTVEQLDEAERAWLAALPVYQQGEGWLAVHGSPRDRTFFNGYVYQMSYEENLDELAARGMPLCFHGHTHIQKTWLRDAAGDRGDAAPRQSLAGVAHALISPGAIGQPRGGEPGVELAIIDLASRELEYLRLDYDMTSVIADMQRLRFPAEMAERLRRGR